MVQKAEKMDKMETNENWRKRKTKKRKQKKKEEESQNKYIFSHVSGFCNAMQYKMRSINFSVSLVFI